MTLSDKTPGVDQNQSSPAESAGNSPMQSLEQINLLVRNCTDCPLSNGRTNSVPGEGNPQADVMFIAKAPVTTKTCMVVPLWAAPASYWADS